MTYCLLEIIHLHVRYTTRVQSVANFVIMDALGVVRVQTA